jgi:hypothetical protein
MPLPTSGEISMSMINLEVGNTAITQIDFEQIALEYNLEGPNYSDGIQGLSLGELYGLNPAAGDFIFSDAYGTPSDSGWTIFNYGAIDLSPTPDEGTNSTIDGVSPFTWRSTTYTKVFTPTTQTADVVVDIPQYDEFNQGYNNYPGTVSGTISTTQPAYNLTSADVSTQLLSVSSQTGEVIWSVGNDGGGPGSVTQNLTKSNPNITSNLPAGQVGVSATNYGVLTNTDSSQTRTVNFYIGVPNGAPDGVSGHQYGNVGSTITKPSTTRTQFSSASIEVGIGSGNVIESAPGLGSMTFDYDDDTWSEGKKLDVDILTGYSPSTMNWSITIFEGNVSNDGTGGGGPGPGTLKVATADGNPHVSSLTGTGPVPSYSSTIKAHPTTQNTTSTQIQHYLKVTTTSNGDAPGGIFYVNVNQNPNITFNTNIATNSTITLANTTDNSSVILTTTLGYQAEITGSGFSVYDGDNVQSATPGNEITGNVSAPSNTFTVNATANTGPARSGTFNLWASSYDYLIKTFNIVQAAGPINEKLHTNIGGSWAAVSFNTFPYTIQQSSTSPYAFPTTSFGFALKTDYAISYSVSIDSDDYLDIGLTSSGGSTTLNNNVTSVTTTPSSEQFYVSIGDSGGQYSNTVFRETVISITVGFEDHVENSPLTIRLQGSGVATPPPTPPTPPGGDPGVPGGCLIYGTQVSMIDGTTKEIQNLVIGDIVKSINIDTMPDGESESLNWSSDTLSYTSAQSEVVGTTEYSVVTIYSFNEGLLEASKEHNHFIKRNNTHMFLRSDNIQVGDYFLNDEDVFVEITSIEQNSDSNNFVYKIDVETKDLFFGNGILTHNAKGGPPE